MTSTFGGTLGSTFPEKYSAKGSDSISSADSSCGRCSGGMFVDDDGSAGAEEDDTSGVMIEVEAEGLAVRIEGSNSRVLSSVRGTFCASRR